MSKYSIAMLLLAAVSGCSQSDSVDSTLESLAFDVGARNYALVFTGSTDGIPGVRADPGNIASVFRDPALGLNFVVQGDTSQMDTQSAPGDTVVKNATTAQILAKTREIAKRMLDEERQTGHAGTMAWFLSSHGGEQGELISQNGCFYFGEVAKAIKEARGGVPLKRLVVFIDVCFSGQTIVGSQRITRQSGQNAMSCDGGGMGGLFPGMGLNLAGVGEVQVAKGDNAYQQLYNSLVKDRGLSAERAAAVMTLAASSYGAMAVNRGDAKPSFGLQAAGAPGDLYEQGFFGASSGVSEESGDMPGQGGTGTVAYVNAFKSLFQSKRAQATFADIEQLTKGGALGQQTPVFNYDPPALRGELVFGGAPQPVKRSNGPAASGAVIDPKAQAQMPATPTTPTVMATPATAPTSAQSRNLIQELTQLINTTQSSGG